MKKGTNITLTFVPTFPEAQDKGDATTHRVVMSGKLVNEFVIFDQVEIEDESGLRLKDPEEAELTYGSWLDYIEDNY